jgi:hypothetical protein
MIAHAPLSCRFPLAQPVNVPIVAGMIYAAPTIGNIIFWQWVNQSANVAVNYANRNASNSMSNEQIASAYGAAVLTSCSLAIGLGHWAKSSKSTVIPRVVPFVSVATAGALNVLMMRQNEARVGIAVRDADGNVRGQSKRAGSLALEQVWSPRWVGCLLRHPRLRAVFLSHHSLIFLSIFLLFFHFVSNSLFCLLSLDVSFLPCPFFPPSLRWS